MGSSFGCASVEFGNISTSVPLTTFEMSISSGLGAGIGRGGGVMTRKVGGLRNMGFSVLG